MTLKIRIGSILNFLLFALVLLWSGSPYQTIYPIIEKLQLPIAVIFAVLFVNKYKKKYKCSFYSLSVIVFFLMIFLTWITHINESLTPYIEIAGFIFIAYFITQIFSFKTVIDVYLKVLTLVATVSLFGHFLLNNTDLLNNLPKLTNVNGKAYGIGIIFNYLVEFPRRNCGIFWEPGIYASFLAIAIIFELCFKKSSVNWFRIILFFVTIITSSSSAGFVLFGFCIMLLITNLFKQKKNIFVNIFGVIALIVLAVLLINLETIILNNPTLSNNIYVMKLLPENAMNNARYLGLLHNIELFMESPISGCGFYTVIKRMAHVADISTSTYLMSIFGILGLFYTVCWFVGIFRQKHLSIYSRIVIFMSFMVILNKETHIMIILTWIIMFGLLKENRFSNNNE